MGWLGWGLYAASRISRGSRRQPFFYTNLATEVVAHYLAKSEEKKKGEPGAPPTAPPKRLIAPDSFQTQDSWTWEESDMAFYRYATEKWKVHTFEHWGVLEFPPGKDAAYNFFGILQIQQQDDRGSLAHGAAPGGELDPTLPLLVLFRRDDGYKDSFAAVQSWTLAERLIEQDRPLREAGKYPRADLAL